MCGNASARPALSLIHIFYSYNEADPSAATAKLERQLTKGEFEVGEVLGVDHAGKLIHYASNEGNPLEQQLWQVSFCLLYTSRCV